ncbi:peptidyl-prolyl cis-trans isomerase [Bartonella schoenbuchensis]|uniref:Parvulin-like PPIase n=1 Tax=Bartonella schoenbuchensis m07a TaxID=1094496 RepID=N6UN27_9HYPH|nr:peptidyl-prolyl cis-trans isomerase [Bartonella schoenbuchensis]ENN91568.1 peptidyl-prolyl cis-trans isomerase D [Bartonella schoenbuchensis m07a]
MLDTLRSAKNSWFARLFFAVLLLCFIFLWGVPQLYTQGERDLLTSGKSTTTVDTYRLALADQSLRLALNSHLGRMFTPEEIQQYRIPAFVLNQLQQDVLFNEQARKMKINLSKDMIAHVISADNIFQENGAFSRDLFLNFLQQLRVNQNDFFDYYTQKEKRNQLTLALLSGMKVPDLFYKAFAIYQEETRIADYFIVNLKEKESTADPDQKTLQKWFDTHKNAFRAPEYRTVSLLSITPEKLVQLEDISKDEAKTYYTQNISRFTTPEKRIIEELRFPTRKEADEAAKKIADGLSFDDLVKAEKKTLNDIKKGPLVKSERPNYLESEIFELKKGQVSTVIDDLQGPVIIRVIDITPSSPIPFETVEKNIRQTLAQNRAATDMHNKYTEIENARFEGASLKEIADQYNLPLRKVTVDKKGKTIEGITLTDLPEKDILLDAIYQANVETEPDLLSLQEGGYLWYQVDTIIPSRDRTLEEVKQDAIAQWKSEEIQRLLDEKAENALKQLNKGKSLDSLAAEFGVKKQTTQALRRQDSSEVFGSEDIKALFSNPKGHYGIAKGTLTTNRIVYKITASAIPDNITAQTISSDVRNNLDMMIREDLKLEILQVANKEHPVKINNSNYNRIFNTF